MQAKRGEKESEVSELLACQKSLGRFETSQAARGEEKRLFSQQATELSNLWFHTVQNRTRSC